MTARNSAPATRSAALHSPDYPRCLSGGYDHFWLETEERVDDGRTLWTCAKCETTRPLAPRFENRTAALARIRKEFDDA